MATITVLDSAGATQTVAKVTATGSATSANSLPVVIASDQAALPLPTGAATSAKQPALGAAATAASTPVNIASDQAVPVILTGSAAQAAIGIIAKPNAFGSMAVSSGTATLMADTFDGTLDTVKWVSGGTSAPIFAGTAVTLNQGTSNSTTSFLTSTQKFTPQAEPFVLGGQLGLGLSKQTNPNSVRLLGVGVVTSFSAATPTTDGHQFEVDITGELCCCVYVAGVRYVVNSTNPALITPSGSWLPGMTLSTFGQTMSWPTSGTAVVQMQYYTGLCYFYMAGGITGMDIPIGFASWVPNVAALNVRVASATTTAGTVLATTLTVNGLVLGIIGSTNVVQNDPNYPWQQQSIDANGNGSVIQPDLFITGQGVQTAANQNIALAVAGTGSNDTAGYSTVMIEVVPTGTVTSGVVTFEASNDQVTFVTVPMYDAASQSTAPVTTISPATGVTRYMIGSTSFRYFRARISTVIGGGGSLQAFTKLSQQPFAGPISNSVIIGSGTLTTLTTLTTCSTVTTVGTLTTLANGQTAHSSASTGSPVRVGGRVNTAVDTTLVQGDASDLFVTSAGQLVDKPYASAELDWTYNAAPSGIVSSTTPVTIKGTPAAGVRNYITAVELSADTLGAATEFLIRDVAVAAPSQTIASNTLTTTGNHGWSIGDTVVPSASGVTGLTAGVAVYVLTVPSATTATFSATPGGTTLAISGTSVTATLNHILWRTKLQTGGIAFPATVNFPTPLRGGTALATEIVTLTSATGGVYFNAQGYIAP